MPFNTIGALFPDSSHSEPVTVAKRDGLLFVWKSEFVDSALKGSIDIVLIYKSPLVKGTSRLYRDTAQMLLGADAQDVLFEAEMPDNRMMHGEGICTLLRLCDADSEHRIKYPVVLCRRVIEEFVSGLKEVA